MRVTVGGLFTHTHTQCCGLFSAVPEPQTLYGGAGMLWHAKETLASHQNGARPTTTHCHHVILMYVGWLIYCQFVGNCGVFRLFGFPQNLRKPYVVLKNLNNAVTHVMQLFLALLIPEVIENSREYILFPILIGPNSFHQSLFLLHLFILLFLRFPP